MSATLQDYRRKRNFGKTSEPAPAKRRAKAAGPRQFVIQKHDASRLHYDLRLELDGVYKSWAVPKGMPLKKGERRLAVQVEDHPLEYGKFEGTIPKGQYGGGTVMLWDRGTWEPDEDPKMVNLAKGKLHFTLHGEKLDGVWYLVRMKDDNAWLVVKGDKNARPVSAKADDTSVSSGHRMKEIAAAGEAEPEPEPAPAKAKKKRKAGPAPEFMVPMMAREVSEPPAGDWLYEIKFDGWRALAIKHGSAVRLYSRNEKDLGPKFPVIVEAFASLDAEDAIVDGEIVALDDSGRSSFQLLQAYELGETQPPLHFYAFDLPFVDGDDLTHQPLVKRKARLETLLEGMPDVVRFSRGLGADGRKLMQKASKLGLEGLIGKRADSLYQAGSRNGAWIKLKLRAQQEFVIGGCTAPEGARNSFGALLIGYYQRGKLHFAGKVGTGFSDRTLREVHAQLSSLESKTCPFSDLVPGPKGRWGSGITPAEMKRCLWVRPRLVCQVRFSEWTRDGRLRQPVFLGMRDDKKASEIKRETPAQP